MSADLVFVNGRVLTMDAAGTVAEALAVTGSAISAVGDEAAVRAAIGPTTRVVDLRGGTLLPGINDSHLHVVSLGAMTPPLSVDVGFPTVRSIAEVAAAVAAAAALRAPGSWITGGGWDIGFLQECLADPQRRPRREDLDAAAPHHPVVLQDFSLHAGWVNTAALIAAGIDPDGNYSDDDMVVTDAEGHPTGVLYERAVYRLLELVPPMTDEQRREAILAVAGRLNALGITSVTDPALGPADPTGPMSGAAIDVYRRMAAAGELTVRVNVLRLPSGLAPSLEEFERNAGDWRDEPTPDPRRFAVVGTKIFADGIPPNKSAWMHAEYVGGGLGSLTVAGDSDAAKVAALREMVRLAHVAGHQIGVHATGDRATDEVIDAFIAANEAHPRADARHYVIHADLISPAAIAKCAQHGIGANMNPAIKWTIADLMTEMLGAERSAYQWPYRSAIDGGVHVASASDAPVTFPDWRRGVYAMLLRTSKATGTVCGPAERITLIEALRTYTTAPAWQDRAETWKGSLEVGKVADLCVLGADLLGADPADIPEVPVVMTVLDGAVVFEGTVLGAAVGAPHQPRVVDGAVGGHYGPSTRLVPSPHGHVCCGYHHLGLDRDHPRLPHGT